MESEMQSLKIVLLGNPEVGKTTLCRKFMGQGFKTNYKPTIGVDFAFKDIIWNGDNYRLQIWDIGSQKLFKQVRRVYYRSVCGALLLYDISNLVSFQNLSDWINEVWTYNDIGIVPVILLANKIDLLKSAEEPDMPVDPRLGENYAKKLSEFTNQHGFKVKFLETSAKTGDNVDQAFQLLIQEILAAHEQKQENEETISKIKT